MLEDPEDIGSNDSDNPSLSEIVQTRFSRRKLMSGSLAAGALGFLGGATALAAPAAASTSPGQRNGRPLIGFEPVPPSSEDRVVVPAGYVAEVLIPWGTPLAADGPAWKRDGSNTAAEQAVQVGMHHDGMHYFPIDGSRRGLLCVNHEYVDTIALYTNGYNIDSTGPVTITKEMVDKAVAAHGVTVAEVAEINGRWRLVQGSRFNRRITGATPVAIAGPVPATHPALQSTVTPRPLGTLNNCAHGYTPWGTYLTCEENWNGYFGTAAAGWTQNDVERRFGLTRDGFGYRWHLADPRFDLNVNRNEPNRFGWVVEIDPFNPASTPVKRTALGRFKHEGATVTEARGHVVVYSGDDENREYVYKYVSARPWRQMIAQGVSPLDEGTLYVARFNADGSGQWLPIVHGQGPLTTANGWADQADVLLRTRMAADALGATKCDRPEWIAVHPKTGKVYVAMTNGSRTADTSPGEGAVNPRLNNPYGHIVWMREDGDNAAVTFRWDIFVLAGDPAYPQFYGSGTPREGVDIFGSPDGLWFDDDGRLWIQTDISNSSQNRPDRGYDRIGNNQMLVADTSTGRITRFLTAPRGCEVTGVVTTPDGETMFVNIQHPGESTTFWNNRFGAPSPSNPRTVSNWPDYDPEGRPRSATIVIRKIRGGKIGT